MESLKASFENFKNTNFRQMLLQVVNLGLVATSALAIWKAMMLFTLCESPVVVVLSGSMEPGFYRGDILFLNMGTKKVENGEIVVFNIDGRDIPIVHRSLRVHTERSTGSQEILTKGDNNYANDRGLYKPGQDWLHKKHLIGRVVGYCPYVGMLTIIMNDYPVLKYLLIGVLGFFVLTSKDEM